MIIGEAFTWGIQSLREKGVANAQLDASLLLCHVLEKDRVYLSVYRDREMSAQQWQHYCSIIESCCMGKPVQYLTNTQEFMSLPFYVEEGVLIPRGDTEVLVESVLERVGKEKSLRILDLCTGSGCIAVSLAHYLSNAKVTAVDISETALKVSRMNAEKNGVANRVEFFLKDILKEEMKGFEPFDVVVSNPPYIAKEGISTLESKVKDFEPRIALTDEGDGLAFYRRIIPMAKTCLRTRGILAVEIGCDQSDTVKALFEESGYSEVQCIQDLAGLDRVVLALLTP